MTVTLCLSCSPDVGVYSIGAFRGPPRSGVAFPTTSGLWLSGILLATAWHPIQLNYIIIQRQHDLPLDLWNRMFNRHQAEITVMQFRGYSLPVHHCSGTMGPSPCPISSALIRPRDLFRLLAIGMCHLGIVFLGRVEGQNITQVLLYNSYNLTLVICLFTNPSAQAGYDTRSIFKRSLKGLILEFFSPRLVASPRLKNPVCPTILLIAGGRIIRVLLFPRVLLLCEMHSVSSRIWTHVTVSISYDDNHYTTGTSILFVCTYSLFYLTHRYDPIKCTPG